MSKPEPTTILAADRRRRSDERTESRPATIK